MYHEYIMILLAFLALVNLGMQFGLKTSNFLTITDEESWIDTYFFMGKLLGYLVIVPILSKLESKLVISSASILLVMSWLVMGFAKSVIEVSIGRFVFGIGDTLIFCAFLAYFMKTADFILARFLVVSHPFLLAMGSNFLAVIEARTSFTNSCLLSVIPPLITFMSFLFASEGLKQKCADVAERKERETRQGADLVERLKVFALDLFAASLFITMAVLSLVLTDFVLGGLEEIVDLMVFSVLYLVIQVLSVQASLFAMDETNLICIRFLSVTGCIVATLSAILCSTLKVPFIISLIVLAVSLNLGIQTVPIIAKKLFTPKVEMVKITFNETYACMVCLIMLKILYLSFQHNGLNWTLALVALCGLISLAIIWRIAEYTMSIQGGRSISVDNQTKASLLPENVTM